MKKIFFADGLDCDFLQFQEQGDDFIIWMWINTINPKGLFQRAIKRMEKTGCTIKKDDIGYRFTYPKIAVTELFVSPERHILHCDLTIDGADVGMLSRHQKKKDEILLIEGDNQQKRIDIESLQAQLEKEISQFNKSEELEYETLRIAGQIRNWRGGSDERKH